MVNDNSNPDLNYSSSHPGRIFTFKNFKKIRVDESSELMEAKYQFINRDFNNYLRNAVIVLYLNKKGISVYNLDRGKER